MVICINKVDNMLFKPSTSSMLKKQTVFTSWAREVSIFRCVVQSSNLTPKHFPV
jgi:hypothetical protein